MARMTRHRAAGRADEASCDRWDQRTDGAFPSPARLRIAAGLAGALVLGTGLAASRIVLGSRVYAPWVEAALYLFVTAAAVAVVVIARRPLRPLAHRFPRAAPGETGRADRPLELFQVDTGEGTRLVRATDVRWIEAAGNYARLHTPEGAFLYRIPLARLEERLGPGFVRVHRSSIVRVDSISRIDRQPSGDAELHLRSGETIRLSRRYARAFHERTGRP